MKEKNPIDDLFRDRLEAHAQKPSANVWDSIESGIEPKQKRVAPLFMLRAASVALLIGISSVWYFNQHQDDLTHIEVDRGKNVAETKKEGPATTKQPEEQGPEKKKPAKKEAEEKEKTVPVMNSRPSKSHQIFVSTEIPPVKEEVDEQIEAQTELLPLEDLEKPTQNSTPKIKVRFKVNPTVTGYYADAQKEDLVETQKPLKEKVWAYASNQVGNIINGRKIDSPIKKGKPELEINLPEIFNN